MHSLKEIQLLCNKQFKLSFTGGELSSDGGLLIIKEFLSALGLEKIIKDTFKATNTASFRQHKDHKNLLQMVYQIFGTYYEDNCADEIRKDPVMSAILGKQEGEGFNYHYRAHGYHPKVCFDGLTGDLLRATLYDGTDYCSKDSADFMKPLISEYKKCYPSIQLYARADSGFAAPELYDLFEDNDVKYAIRLKINKTLTGIAQDKADALMTVAKRNAVDYAVTYGEFMYKAGSWRSERRVIFKIEKPANQFTFLYTFIVTNMEMEPYQVISYYCNRGRMDNFIGECKDGFGKFKEQSSKCQQTSAPYSRLQYIQSVQASCFAQADEQTPY